MSISTENYLSHVRHAPWLQQAEKNSLKPFVERLVYHMHMHIKTTTAIKVSIVFLGIATIAMLPLLLPVLGLGSVAIAAVGGLVALITIIAHNILGLLVQPHDMASHAFKTGTYKEKGIVYGKLSYEQHVPVLTLNLSNPYLAGKAHGYLLADSLQKVRKGFQFGDVLLAEPKAHQLPQILKKVQEIVPKPYLDEIKGIVAGFNKWAEEQPCYRRPDKITFEELLLFHLKPDCYHLSNPEAVEQGYVTGQHPDPKKMPQSRSEQRRKRLQGMTLGCMAVIDGDRKNGLTFARNMDWPAFGIAGKYSLLIKREGMGYQSAEVALPGLVGTLTGINEHGLSLAMNVCPGEDVRTTQIKGLPAVFFNRYCLESCINIDEAAAVVNNKPALGTYHLTVADPTGARAFQMHTKVQRDWREGEPLLVSNRRYDEQGKKLELNYSHKREELIGKLFSEAMKSIDAGKLDRGKLAEFSLSMPYVNNKLSTHTVIMKPRQRQIAVAFDNAYSASKTPLTIPAARLFRQQKSF